MKKSPSGTRQQRSSSSLAISVVLHGVLGAGLIRVLLMPGPVADWLGLRVPAKPKVEKVTYVAMSAPPPAPSSPSRARSGGDGRTDTGGPIAPPMRAPTSVPTGIAPSAGNGGESGSGRVVGSGGLTRGVVPSYSDPRVWGEGPGKPILIPRSGHEMADSILALRIPRVADSLEAARKNSQPGAIMLHKGGKDYGIDEKGNLKIAGLTIPSFLVPKFRAVQDPNVDERQRVAALNSETVYQAQRALNEDDFRKAVHEIRERKDRERAAARAAQQQAQQAGSAPAPAAASP